MSSTRGLEDGGACLHLPIPRNVLLERAQYVAVPVQQREFQHPGARAQFAPSTGVYTMGSLITTSYLEIREVAYCAQPLRVEGRVIKDCVPTGLHPIIEARVVHSMITAQRGSCSTCSNPEHSTQTPASGRAPAAVTDGVSLQ